MTARPPIPDVFASGGQVGADLAAVDWAATPLGPVDAWPQSLVSAVRIVLSSRFSMWMGWGPDLVFFCNEAYRRDTLGAKYPWALGRPTREVWAEIWPDLESRIDTVMRSGQATWDEALLLFLERSGYPEETYHTFSYSPLTDDDGEVVGLLCVVSEVTDGVIGARRLDTLRGLGAALSGVRSEREVVDAACEQLAQDTRSLPFTLLLTYDHHGAARLAGSSGVPAGHPLLDELEWALPTGEAPHATADLRGRADLPTGSWTIPPREALVVPLRQQSGAAPLGLLVAALNPHRERDGADEGFVAVLAGQLAAALSAARSYDDERERAQRLAELDRAKTTFFTNVSHELRTPLTLLLGPVEDALRDPSHPLDDVQRSRLELVSRNAERLLKLVNTLLDFSRLEAGSVQAQLAPVDLAALTRELAEAFAPACARAGLTLSVVCPDLDSEVWVDPEMWSKVVLNLLSNALKHTFEGTIEVRLRPLDGDGGPDQVLLEVSDTGTGIPADQQAKLFERFHRVDGARSRTHEGSGIGLALVAELVGLHGGTVDVRSTPGEGSTFAVRLPRVSGEAVDVPESSPVGLEVSRTASAFLSEAARWVPQADQTGGNRNGVVVEDRPTVLVVDDNADMRDYVSGLLSEHYDVVTAVDGLDGLRAAREAGPDLVLTDVMMPGLDGFELLARLRNDPQTSHLPVVMLSARAGEEATVEGLDAGADDYLVKPFGGPELLARIRANLELDRVRRAGEQLSRGQALLDQAQRLAGVGSWEMDLGTGAVRGSEEFLRQTGLAGDDVEGPVLDSIMAELIHPDDVASVRQALDRGMAGVPIDYEVRMRAKGASEFRVYRTLGEVVRAADGTPVMLRGSNQDVTEVKRAEQALAAAEASAQVAAREHRIADELQASLLPPRTFDPDHLDVATYYRAGVAGTQVGGDWYDVIELGAGRTALVIGDVMGRGVRAAAVMGQLRSAVRAYARLDLPPADLLEHLDAAVREIGRDQIVTCVYAVYDPGERSLTYASAGHLPPLLLEPGQPPRRLTGSAGAPLGIGQPGIVDEVVSLSSGSQVALYTDGLVESRDSDIDVGIDALAEALVAATGDLQQRPQQLVDALLPHGPDDDVAVLLVQVDHRVQEDCSLHLVVADDLSTIAQVRARVRDELRLWGAPVTVQEDVELIVSELVTNALVHGRPGVELRLRSSRVHLVLEVEDRASYLPRRMRPGSDDEHGRGLQLVRLLSSQWGTRPTAHGKVVWCAFPPLRDPSAPAADLS